MVAIIGYLTPRGDAPGHDLTYLAEFGLLSAPDMPRTLLADLAGAERAVSTTLALLLNRQKQGAGYAEVALSEAAAFFAEPLRYGITKPGAELGGQHVDVVMLVLDRDDAHPAMSSRFEARAYDRRPHAARALAGPEAGMLEVGIAIGHS